MILSPSIRPGPERPAPLRSGDRLQLDDLPLRLSVNRRARRVSIRIDAVAGEAVLTAPSERALPKALEFARTRTGWIREHLADKPETIPFAPGATIPLHGEPVRLVATGTASAARMGRDADGAPAILSGGEGAAFSRRVERFLKAEARKALEERTAVHLARLGLAPVKISIGDPRARWGSCSPHNRSIRYSWRVVMAPPAVLDYLAAHEVAHLVRADHSPAFWAVVEDLIGDHRAHRRWLREHGAALQAAGRN